MARLRNRLGKLANTLGAGLVWTLVALGSLVVSFAYHAQLESTRELARDQLQTLVSQTLAGDLRVGSVDRLGLWRLAASDVEILDPAGRVVLSADHLEVHTDLTALLEGRVRLSSLEIPNAEVYLYVAGPEGNDISLVQAFSSATPKEDDIPGPVSPIPILLDNMHIEHGLVAGDVPNYSGLRVEELELTGSISFHDSIVFRVEEGAGIMRGPYPGDTIIDSAEVVFDTNWSAGLDVRMHIHRDEDQVDAHLTIVEDPANPGSPGLFDLDARILQFHGQTAADMGLLEPAALVRGPVAGTARLSGPLRDLGLTADLVHEGGPLHIEGHLPAGGAIELGVQTENFALERLVPQVPPVRLTGHVGLQVVPREPTETPSPDAQSETPPRILVDADLEPFTIVGVAIPALTTHAEIVDDSLMIQDLHAPHSGGSVDVHGRVGFDASLDLHASVNLPEIGREPNIAAVAPGAHGSLSARVDIHADENGDNLSLGTHAQLRRLRYGPLRVASLDLRGRVHGALSRPIASAELQASDLEISGLQLGDVDAEIEGGPRTYTARWESRGSDIHELGFTALVTPRDGGAQIEMPQLSVDLEGAGPMSGTLSGLRISPSELQIDSIDLARDEQTLSAGARIPLGGGSSDIRAELDGYQIDRLTRLLGLESGMLSGVLDTQLDIEGPLSDPSIELRGEIADLLFEEVRNADLHYDFLYHAGELHTKLRGDFGTRGLVSVDGDIAAPFAALTSPERFLREARFGLHLSAGHFNLAFILPLLDESIQSLGITGRLSGDLTIGGTYHDLIVGPGAIILDRLSMPDMAEFRIKIRFSLADDELVVDHIWVADPSGEVALLQGSMYMPIDDLPSSAAGFLARTASHPWKLAARLSPRMLTALPRPLPRGLPEGIRLEAIMEAQGGDGATARGQFDGTLEWTEPATAAACASNLRPRMHVRADIRDDRGTITAQGFVDTTQMAEVIVTMPVAADDWIGGGTIELPHPNIDASVTALNLAELPWTCERASGTVNGTFSMRDALSATPSVDVQLGASDLRITGRGGYLLGAQPNRVEVQVRADDTVIGGCALISAEGQGITPFSECGYAPLPNDTETIVRGALPIRWHESNPIPEPQLDDAMELSVLIAEAHLGPLLAFIPQIANADIVADGSLHAMGPWDSLTLDGGFAVRDGTVNVTALGQHLSDIRGSLRFDDQRARAIIPREQPLSARDGDGVVDIWGEIGLSGLAPTVATLNVESNQFPVRNESAVVAALTGNAVAEVAFRDESLEGSVRIPTLTVRLPEQLAGSTQSLEPHPQILVVGTEARDSRSSSGAVYPINIHIDASTPFRVHRNDFDVQIDAQLDVAYVDPNLLITGNANIRRGYFEVFGKRFEVASGAIALLEGPELNPFVNVVATYQVPGTSNGVITISATGSLSNLSIDFDSTLTSDKGEIIALLVGGQRSIGSGDSSSSGQQELTSQTASVLTGIMAGVLTLGLRQQFGDLVPLLAVETGSNLGDTRIRAGFDVNSLIPDFARDVVQGAYLEGFVTTSGGQSSGSSSGVGGGVRLELQFPNNFVGSGTYIPPVNWAADLLWEP